MARISCALTMSAKWFRSPGSRIACCTPAVAAHTDPRRPDNFYIIHAQAVGVILCLTKRNLDAPLSSTLHAPRRCTTGLCPGRFRAIATDKYRHLAPSSGHARHGGVLRNGKLRMRTGGGENHPDRDGRLAAAGKPSQTH